MSSRNFVNATLKNVKERKSKEKNEVLYVRKDPDKTQIHKKELDEKFITDNRKHRKKKLVVETNSKECDNSGTSSQQVKSSLPLSYADVTKTGQIEKEVNFSELYLDLLETEQTRMKTTPSTLCTNSSENQNSSCSLVESNKTEYFSIQDRKRVSILVDLGNVDNNSEVNVTGKTRLSGNFCSDTILNLSRKVLTDSEIKVIEKGFGYAIQSKINEPNTAKYTVISPNFLVWKFGEITVFLAVQTTK